MATLEATVTGTYRDSDALEEYVYAVQGMRVYGDAVQGMRVYGVLPSEACRMLTEVAFEAVRHAEDDGMTPSEVSAHGVFRTPGGREYWLTVAFEHDGAEWWGAEGSMNIEPLSESELPDALAHIARDDYESARALAEALAEEHPEIADRLREAVAD